MIKVATNLQRLTFVKLAETEEEKALKQLEKAKLKDRRKAEKDEVPNEERRVDYAGRARRGALIGALLGAVPGAYGGYKMINQGDSPALQILKTLGGSALGATLYGGVGALGNALAGAVDADIIERRSEPSRLSRGLFGAAGGVLPGAVVGAGLGVAGGRFEKGDLSSLALPTLLGGLGGAGLGYLGGAYVNPWLNKDLYSQKYLQD